MVTIKLTSRTQRFFALAGESTEQSIEAQVWGNLPLVFLKPELKLCAVEPPVGSVVVASQDLSWLAPRVP